MSQNEVIKKHLQQGHRLTPIYALKEFGCFRLASRINDLRNEGMNIKTVKATLPSGKRIAVYHLERDNV